MIDDYDPSEQYMYSKVKQAVGCSWKFDYRMINLLGQRVEEQVESIYLVRNTFFSLEKL